MQLEVCVDSIESAIAAKEGGANRLEICSALPLGGTTPCYGLVERCVQLGDIQTAMMIRPRDGDFHYDENDLKVIRSDIEAAKRIGVDMVVFGALQENLEIDLVVTQQVIEWARPLQVTFHRAFDITPDPMRTIDHLIELRIDRLLTSGQKPKAISGVDLIARLVKHCGNHLKVMAGSGVSTENVVELIEKTNVAEIHSSASIAAAVPRGSIQFQAQPRRVTDASVVRQLIKLANTKHR